MGRNAVASPPPQQRSNAAANHAPGHQRDLDHRSRHYHGIPGSGGGAELGFEVPN